MKEKGEGRRGLESTQDRSRQSWKGTLLEGEGGTSETRGGVKGSTKGADPPRLTKARLDQRKLDHVKVPVKNLSSQHQEGEHLRNVENHPSPLPAPLFIHLLLLIVV